MQRLRLLPGWLQPDADAHGTLVLHLDLDAAAPLGAEQMLDVAPEGGLQTLERHAQAFARLPVDAGERRLELGDRQRGLHRFHLERVLALLRLVEVGGGTMVDGAETFELARDVAEPRPRRAFADFERRSEERRVGKECRCRGWRSA